MKDSHYNVVVVGGGNTALIAALTAYQAGAPRVCILEAAPKSERGGNSRFSGTAWRFVHSGRDHLLQLLADQEALDEAQTCNMAPYTAEDFTRDMLAKSGGRHDREEIQTIIDHGFDTMKWMAEQGVPFKLPKNYWVDQSDVKGQVDLASGVPVVTKRYGQGLVDAMWAAVEKTNVDVFYEMPAHELIADGDKILGLIARSRDGYHKFYGKVILACGGFEANPRMRRQYLGEGTEFAIVRGTRFNTGVMMERAIAAGAQQQGHWGGYHCAPQDVNAPRVGDIKTLDAWERYSFPFSITVNTDAKRFFDEGEDEISLIYSKMGEAIARQKDAKAFQIFDQKVVHLVNQKYKDHSTPIVADTVEALAEKLSLSPSALSQTVTSFNAATSSNKTSDPFTKDSLSTAPGYAPPKSNWALPIDKPPFVAYPVTVGITFTFGGIKTDQSGQVLNNEGNVMPGLYAMGEMTGGFYYGYAAGASLIRSSVMARIAGEHAAMDDKMNARL